MIDRQTARSPAAIVDIDDPHSGLSYSIDLPKGYQEIYYSTELSL